METSKAQKSRPASVKKARSGSSTSLERDLIPLHVRPLIPPGVPDRHLYLALTIAISAYEAGRQAGLKEGAASPSPYLASIPSGYPTPPAPVPPPAPAPAGPPQWAVDLARDLGVQFPGRSWLDVLKADKVFGDCIKNNVEPSLRLRDMRLQALLKGVGLATDSAEEMGVFQDDGE